MVKYIPEKDLYLNPDYSIMVTSSQNKLFTPRIIIKDSFRDTILSIKDANIKLPLYPEDGEEFIDPNLSAGRVEQLEEEMVRTLDIKSGMDFSRMGITIAAYDESIQRYSSMEGKAVFTAHAIVIPRIEDYAAITYLTAYFYTKSEEIGRIAGFTTIKDGNMEPSYDKLMDELYLMQEVPPDTVLFIDGPLIAGDVYTTMISEQKRFKEKNIVPVFFVKNSNSNLILDYTNITKNRYNSDMHWASSILKAGQRTSFFRYTDAVNERNTKVFCYLKFFSSRSPVRVEFFTDIYRSYSGLINSIMDLVLYMLICQGNPKNTQIRPIAIAEMYAREIVKIVNVKEIMRKSGVTSTMNEERDFEEGE